MSLVSEFIDRNTKDLQKLGGKGGGKSSPGGSSGLGGLKIDLNPNLDIFSSSGLSVDPLGVVDAAKTGVETFGKSVENSLASSDLAKGIPNISLPSQDQWAPNLDQDWMQLNPEKLQAAAVAQGAKFQQGLVDIGSASQAAFTTAGKQAQQNLIQLGTDFQRGAIEVGSKVQETAIDIGSLTGQRNPTLEAAASGITKATEANIAGITNAVEVNNQSLADWWRANEQGFTKEAEAAVQSTVETVEFLGGQVTKGAEMFLEDVANLFMPSGGGGGGGGEATALQDLPELPTTDEAVFPEIEQATTKADQMTEEERLRRIRRLMLNRYGREDTILTGTADPTRRRRTAPGFMGM